MHRLAQRGVGEDRVHQLGLGRLELAGDGHAVDELGHLGADHVRAQQLAAVGVEHRLHHAFGLAQCQSLAVGGEAVAPHLDGAALGLRRSLGQAHAGDLRRAVGAGRNGRPVQWFRAGNTGDVLDANHRFVACLVRQPGGTRQVADREDAGLVGLAERARQHMAVLDANAGLLQPQVLDVAADADGQDHPLGDDPRRRVGRAAECGGEAGVAAFQRLDPAADVEVHALADDDEVEVTGGSGHVGGDLAPLLSG